MWQRVIFVTALMFAVAASGAETAQEKFASGVQAYRAKDYDKAKDAFNEALHLAPKSPSTLYNLALCEEKLGQKGVAVAHLRQALSLDPSDTAAQRTYNQWASKIDRPFATHESSNWEVLRESMLRTVSPAIYLSLTSLLFLLSGWLLIGYFGKRRVALRDEQPLPALPTVGVIFSGIFLVLASLSVSQGLDYLTPRATVLADKTEVKSSPTGDSATLFELNQGIEVVVRDAADTWAQITYPGGMTGWVPKERILHSSGRSPW